ncbi:MAG TPA: hypothetical protein VGM03_15785 [Phycisphaerae bacterium]
MLKKLSFVASVVMALSVSVWACPPECTGGDKAGTVAHKSGCCKTNALVAKVMQSLPHVTYKIGDQETACPEEAAKLAKADEDVKIVYLVGNKSFESKDEAFAQLATVLDSEAEKMLTVRYSVDGECMYCPMSAAATAKAKNTEMKYRVAGVDFANREQAEKAIDLAKAAVAKVSVTIKAGEAERTVTKLDDDSKPCSAMKATFIVNGEETHCPIQAKLLLAQARIRAMIEAAAAQAS